MNILTQTDCCTMLGIDPKTLRNWLRQAHMPFTTHPTDARLKCLTQAQVQQLAALHARPLSSPLTAHPSPPNEALLSPAIPSLQKDDWQEADLGQSLARLQAQVTTMQEQLTGLALELLRERELRLEWLSERQQQTEQRLCMLEALVAPVGKSSPAPQAESATCVMDLPHTEPDPEPRSPLPGSVRGRRGALPLIASTATGTYVIICPTHGELPLAPDSPQWFDWLATLSSFRFVGQQGRLSASRTTGRPCWMAYRRIHGHCYSYGLGNTKRLTIAHLEQMAATLQSHVSSH